MTNKDKLLRAFIEAQGFEIKEVKQRVSSGGCSSTGCWHKSELVTVDYKVTKKPDDAQRRYNLYNSALMEYQSGATTLAQFTEITKGLL